jgi:hypothetical protein
LGASCLWLLSAPDAALAGAVINRRAEAAIFKTRMIVSF